MNLRDIIETHSATHLTTPDYDLQAKYQHYNKLVWNDQLPTIRII